MQPNQLRLVIAALAVVIVALGIYIWRQESQPDGVEIRLDENGVSIEQN